MGERTRGWIPPEERRKAEMKKKLKLEENNLASIARKKIKKMGVTTEQLAEDLKISKGSVQKFKDNPFELNGEILLKCCAATGIVLGVVNDEA